MANASDADLSMPFERSPRDRIIDAVMALAAEQPWSSIELSEIAERAEVTLAEFRDAFPSKGAVLGGFSKRIDRIVLDATPSSFGDEPVRERVLDIMMRRFDALLPYREALRSIMRDLRGHPLALAALGRGALNTQRFMLAAVGVDTEDDLGPLKVQGAAAVFGRAFEVFLDDDEPDLARTMARLDRELDRGERLLRLADDVHALTAPFRAFAQAVWRRPRRSRDSTRDRMRAPRSLHDDDPFTDEGEPLPA